MHPILFARFVWVHLAMFGKWTEENGTLVGAITFAVVGSAGLIVYMRRNRLSPARAWIEANAVITILIAAPVVAFVLLCLNKYLTFASATAATVGVLVALENNNRTHDKDEKRFERQGKAARAALTLELSTICDYCEATGTILKGISTSNPIRAGFLIEDIVFPPPPASAAATFKEMISSTKDEAIADRCSLVLSHIQLVKANLNNLHNSTTMISNDDIASRKFRIAILYALTVSLFHFARNRKNEVAPFDWSALGNAVANLNFDSDHAFIEYYRESKAAFPDDPLDFYDI